MSEVKEFARRPEWDEWYDHTKRGRVWFDRRIEAWAIARCAEEQPTVETYEKAWKLYMSFVRYAMKYNRFAELDCSDETFHKRYAARVERSLNTSDARLNKALAEFNCRIEYPGLWPTIGRITGDTRFDPVAYVVTFD